MANVSTRLWPKVMKCEAAIRKGNCAKSVNWDRANFQHHRFAFCGFITKFKFFLAITVFLLLFQTLAQHDVEAAIETADLQAKLYRKECIARPHAEMIEWMFRPQPFMAPVN